MILPDEKDGIGLAVGLVNTWDALHEPPERLYSVERLVPLSLTQTVPPDETDMPHGLTRFGSTCCATPGMSD